MGVSEPVTGILLVGGASRRFGSPKAVARVGDETLAERAWGLLGASCDFRLAVGKLSDGLSLPFAVADDGTDVRAPLAGVVAGLRLASTDLCVVLPVDCPDLSPAAVQALAAACRGQAAIPPTGPLPGAYRRSVLPALERRLAAGELRLRDAVAELDCRTVRLPGAVLRNVNTVSDLSPPPYTTRTVGVVRAAGGRGEDVVAVEEPLEIRIGGEPIAITMRTPGHDEELALGFALGEGLEPAGASLPAGLPANTVELEVAVFDPARLRRSFYTTSSCGVCGKGALEAVAVVSEPSRSTVTFPSRLLASLPDLLRAAQPAFAATGGLHAAGLFDRDGIALCVREDVGRHNAVDKVVGWAFRHGRLPLDEHAICVSGRLSFELVQKSAAASCPVLVGVGAPSSLAIELARAQNVTLCGFTRGGRVNVYAAEQRVGFE
jgi:FdhD protein